MDAKPDGEFPATPTPSLADGRRYRAWTIVLCGLVLVEQAFELELELRGGFLLFGLLLLAGLFVLITHSVVALIGLNRALYSWTGGHPDASRATYTFASPLQRVLVCLALAAAPWCAWSASTAASLPSLGFLLLHHGALTAAVRTPGLRDTEFEAERRVDGAVEIFLGPHGLMDCYVLIHNPDPVRSERHGAARHLIGPWYLADWGF